MKTDQYGEYTLFLWKRTLKRMNGLKTPYPSWLSISLAKAMTEVLNGRWVKAQALLLLLEAKLPKPKARLRLVR